MSNALHPSALIGATGFVGGNLSAQFDFDEHYGSQTVAHSAGKHYALLVSAGPGAVKWKANKFPDEDRAMIDDYIGRLSRVSADAFVGVSTCDVYETPRDVDEDTDITPTLATLHPYGKHRFLLEEFMREHFPDHLIVRLPGLFGHGLKKNVIFDLLYDNALDAIHHASAFQFYNLNYLWRDIERARKAGFTLLNITTEPVTVGEVAQIAFGREFTNTPPTPPARYDLRSKHADLYGGKDGYMYDKKSVLRDIRDFVLSERGI